MRVLVVGGGGREHALVWKLAQSPHVRRVYCVSGNGGTTTSAKCQNVDIDASDIASLARFARGKRIDLTVVGPEAPLIAGISNQWPSDLRIWGPKAQAAMLEGSKIHANDEKLKYNIPAPRSAWFDDQNAALDWLAGQPDQGSAVKEDGLSGGKGVFVCDNKRQTETAIRQMRGRSLIEERLYGLEASLFLLCGPNGQIIPFATAQDYKRAYDDDKGPNTGGMGAYSPARHLSPEMIGDIIAAHQPLIADVGFTGFLYIGLMLTNDGWKVLEYNVRMGDPEAQVVLPRLETDLAVLLYAMAGGEKYMSQPKWSDQAAVTVIMASGGYPGEYEIGFPITGLDRVQGVAPGATVFHAGTRRLEGGQVVTNGGRVLNITALGDNIATARLLAYRAAGAINWPDVEYRRDIAAGI